MRLKIEQNQNQGVAHLKGALHLKPEDFSRLFFL